MPRSFRGYEIQGKLGAGGMSTLYLGIQTALNRKVAVKMLHPGLADDENFISRFEREAKTASGIGHRNIVSVFDFGVEDDVYYIIMELVQGTDLKDALAKTGRIPPEVVLAMLEEVSYGLEAAHEQGVIHRDMKPSNVMLSKTGEVKIADFGLARQSSDISRLSALTLPGSVLGTPAYMSPEQAAGKEVDHRTDIYSLGVMAYELLTGEKPFRGSSYSEIRDQIINHDPPPLNRAAPVTGEIEALVDRMLAKDPDKRFPAMRHVIRAIEDCMETLDPTGGLIKHRRKYLGEFAQDPVGFSEKLRMSSIAAHLDRGFYFKQMGLAKIDDAAREFRYVIFLDPDNTKANDALHDLEKQAEESGVRLPPRAVREASAAPAPATPPEKASSSSRPSVLSDPSADTRPTARSVARASGTRAADKTRVLGGEAAVGATQVLDSGARRAGAGLGARLWVPLAVVVLVAAALVVWKLRPAGGPAGAIALATQPPGAAVFVRGPNDAEFRPTGLVTNCRLEKLADGPWEVRVELAGFRPQARRVEVAANEQTLTIAMASAAQEGRFALATVPAGATVGVRRPGEGDFRPLPGKTPLTSEPLAAGRWEVRAEAPGVGRLTRTVDVTAGGLAEVKWDLTKERDVGRVDVTSVPTGATIRTRAKGAKDFAKTGKNTPASLDNLAAGDWEVRLEKDGFAPQTLAVAVNAGGTETLSFTLAAEATSGGTTTASTTGSSSTPARDGFASIIIVPFADIYVDGRLFQSQARRAVIPLAAGKTHSIELRHPTFGSRTFRSVKAAAGDTTDLGRYDFKWGQVRVFTKPGLPCDLVIDGKAVSRQTPYSDKIVAGEHRFAVSKTGYRITEVVVSDPEGGERHVRASASGEVTVDVPADKEVRVQFVLAKVGG